MSAFDDLPPGAVLPPFTDEDQARAQSVLETGRLHLADVDEAELAAIGVPPLPRQGRPDIAEPDVAAGAERLVARGLAEPVPWAAGRVRPAGVLLMYTQLSLHPKKRVGMIETWLAPEPVGAIRTLYRLGVLIDVVHGGLAGVDRASLPAEGGAPALAVSLDLLRLDLLVAAAVSTAFGDDEPTVRSGRETLVLFADGAGKQQPTRLRISDAGVAELETSRHGLLGAKTVRQRVDREGFADHLRLRFMAAG